MEYWNPGRLGSAPPPAKKRPVKTKNFDSLNPQFHNPRAYDSNIPEFQHSNLGRSPQIWLCKVLALDFVLIII